MEILRGNSPEDIKIRKQIIGDFYASWCAEHPEKKIWNKALKAFIHVKFHSINETKGHASGTFESTEAVLHLTEFLKEAKVKHTKARKQEDKNQKMFSRIVILRHGPIKLTVGLQRSKGEYIQHCITVPGARMNKN